MKCKSRSWPSAWKARQRSLYGKQELYKLKLSNSGNGAAENVMLTLAPLGTGENRPVSHRIASLAAGEQRVLEVELTARETGTLTIQADIKADGGAHAELAEKVLIRRAALQIDVEAPTMQYVGAGAIYRVRVRNPGNAPAKNVRLSAAVPPGGKYVSSSDGGRVADGGGQVQWTLESLDPGVERVFTLQCSLGLAGPARMAISLSADDELTASAEAMTRVEAMADLRLDVKEPDGPIPVGEEAVYEAPRPQPRHERRRRTFRCSPISRKGSSRRPPRAATYRIAPGQVAFNPLPTVPAGEEVALKIRARADVAGEPRVPRRNPLQTLGNALGQRTDDALLSGQTGGPAGPASVRGGQVACDDRPCGATIVRVATCAESRRVKKRLFPPRASAAIIRPPFRRATRSPAPGGIGDPCINNPRRSDRTLRRRLSMRWLWLTVWTRAARLRLRHNAAVRHAADRHGATAPVRRH